MLAAHLGWLVAGVLCAAAGGELFVRATVGIASAARVAPAIVATTVVAFATSTPELSVAVNAALAGEPGIALGNALGANVVNVALTLGLTLCIAAIVVRHGEIRRDLAVAMLAPIATWFAGMDGNISRADAAVLMLVFVAWLAAVLLHVRRQREQVAAQSAARADTVSLATMLLAGLALLVLAGRLVVQGGTGIADAFGLDEFVVGATVVAIGTSMPELATSVVALARGRGEIGLGTILGSNVFNGLAIVPLAALITPIDVGAGELVVALAVSLLALVALVPGRAGRLGRARGVYLLGLYTAYLWAMLAIG